MTDLEQLTEMYGDPALAPPETETLNAGLLSVVVTSNGDIRYIRYGEHEMIRRVYAAVRASDWWTVAATITVREKVVQADSFRMVSEARYTATDRGIDFQATITVTGESDGRVTFDFDGEALSDFERKRIGICVLHPADAKGAPVTITHTDGSEETGALPDTISPHQPFFDIVSIRHSVAPRLEAEVMFTGDIFEMEDQRNWLDASFKTYSTPLALPSPVLVKVGERVRQTVTVRPHPPAPLSLGRERGEKRTGRLALVRKSPLSDLPPLPSEGEGGGGVRAPSLGITWVEEFAASKSDLSLPASSHIWLELNVAEKDWKMKFRRVEKAAGKLGISLYVFYRNVSRYANTNGVSALYLRSSSVQTKFFSEQQDWDTLNQLFGTQKYDITTGAYADLGLAFPSNFTELNRVQPKTFATTALAFAGNPQVHASDSLSIAETPPMITEAIRTGRTFANGRPIHVGPLTFTGPYAADDPRETAQFGQDWYRQILAYAVESGADSVTLGAKALPVLQEWFAQEKAR